MPSASDKLSLAEFIFLEGGNSLTNTLRVNPSLISVTKIYQ